VDVETSCLWCGEPIRRRGSRGRVPSYCSDRCRQRAARFRRSVEWQTPLAPAAVVTRVSPRLVIMQAVRELRSAAVALAAAAPYVPRLAGRAERTALAVKRVLDEEWGDEGP